MQNNRLMRFSILVVFIGAGFFAGGVAQSQSTPAQTTPAQTTLAQATQAAPSSEPVPPTLEITKTPNSEKTDTPEGFFEILMSGGPVGIVILLLSVGTVALVIEHVLTIRATVLMPEGLAEQVRELLRAGHITQAVQQCKLQPSFLAHVLQAGLGEIDGKWPAIEKALEDTTAEQSARLYRKIEYLCVIGNIAPMLGLLGTVIGMIFAFREVASTQGAARAADLAEGIYLALITTVMGLLVAIPSLAAFAVFRNRIDQFVAEAAHMAQHVFTPFKRSRRAAPPPAVERKG